MAEKGVRFVRIRGRIVPIKSNNANLKYALKVEKQAKNMPLIPHKKLFIGSLATAAGGTLLLRKSHTAVAAGTYAGVNAMSAALASDYAKLSGNPVKALKLRGTAKIYGDVAKTIFKTGSNLRVIGTAAVAAGAIGALASMVKVYRWRGKKVN